jgi:hypothetical protein
VRQGCARHTGVQEARRHGAPVVLPQRSAVWKSAGMKTRRRTAASFLASEVGCSADVGCSEPVNRRAPQRSPPTTARLTAAMMRMTAKRSTAVRPSTPRPAKALAIVARGGGSIEGAGVVCGAGRPPAGSSGDLGSRSTPPPASTREACARGVPGSVVLSAFGGAASGATVALVLSKARKSRPASNRSAAPSFFRASSR